MAIGSAVMNVRNLGPGSMHVVGRSGVFARYLAARPAVDDEDGLPVPGPVPVDVGLPFPAPHAIAAVPPSLAVPSPSRYPLSRISHDLARWGQTCLGGDLPRVAGSYFATVW